jgi:uroporphyrinogen-III decarboxylase
LAQRFGDEALILLNEGNPVCGVFDNGGPAGDFQDALVATVEHPENMAYLIWRLHDPALARMRVLKRKGAHGYIGSETCVSCDMMSPATLRALVFPAQRRFYTEVESMGLIPVTYYLGEILPVIDDIASLGAKALLIEEPKKGFHLDAVEIHDRLRGRMALFGNLDSVYTLLFGKPDAVRAETLRQCACAKKGSFVMACGSPLCYDTPEENIFAMMETARSVSL